MSRTSPFEHAFAALAAQHFAGIRQDASDQHKNTTDLPQFASLGTVQRLLDELHSPEALETEPEAAAEYLAGLYVAFRFWDADQPTFPVDRERLELALEQPLPATFPRVPDGACYLQLPERWFWAQVESDEPHEPIDGLFVVEGAYHREILLLVVLGLRSDRPGFSQVSLSARAEDLAQAADEARQPLFTPVLDGGKAAGLKSLVSEADVLVLAHLGLQTVSGE
ncbi:MAG: hypothetical protein PVH40_00325 [Gemmatimonadales bacterium]|jgi:hypothetical protein